MNMQFEPVNMDRSNFSIVRLAPQPEVFMDAAVRLAALFLSCGGPVTRLEAQLVLAGTNNGFDTNVNATPSSIVIYCHDEQEKKTYSRGRRIENFSVDLGRLRKVDRLLNRLTSGDLSATHVLVRLDKIRKTTNPDRFLSHCLCLLGIGAGAALLTGADVSQSLIAAIFTLLVQLFVTGVHRSIRIQNIFIEFLSCFSAFFLSLLVAHYIEIPARLLSIGTLVYIVPGLLMTTAISEIVDQNYLSGTIRLLKAFYTFMSMALAYFLAQDLITTAGWTIKAVAYGGGAASNLLFQMIGSSLIVFCSSLEFHANRKSLLGIMLCGSAGAFIFFLVSSQSYLVLSTFVAAFVIGLISFWLSRRSHHPSQIYSVPSILILVPGMLAFSSFGYGRTDATVTHLSTDFMVGSLVQALLISLAIVFGLAAGRLEVLSRLSRVARKTTPEKQTSSP